MLSSLNDSFDNVFPDITPTEAGAGFLKLSKYFFQIALRFERVEERLNKFLRDTRAISSALQPTLSTAAIYSCSGTRLPTTPIFAFMPIST